MPRLVDLDAHLLAYAPEKDENGKPLHRFKEDVPMSLAHGIRFACPKAFAINHGLAGTHMIQVYFAGSPVPPELGRNRKGEPVRWQASGSGLDDLSLSPSIQEDDDICKWHGWVGNSGIPRGSAA